MIIILYHPSSSFKNFVLLGWFHLIIDEKCIITQMPYVCTFNWKILHNPKLEFQTFITFKKSVSVMLRVDISWYTIRIIPLPLRLYPILSSWSPQKFLGTSQIGKKMLRTSKIILSLGLSQKKTESVSKSDDIPWYSFAVK